MTLSFPPPFPFQSAGLFPRLIISFGVFLTEAKYDAKAESQAEKDLKIAQKKMEAAEKVSYGRSIKSVS